MIALCVAVFCVVLMLVYLFIANRPDRSPYSGMSLDHHIRAMRKKNELKRPDSKGDLK